MPAILLSLALLAASTPGDDLPIANDSLGIALRCPRAICEADAGLDETPVGPELGPTRGLLEAKVVEGRAGAALGAAMADEKKYLGRFFALSYERLKPGSFAVLSGLGRGLDADKVVYEKLVLGARGPVGLRVVYLAARKAELDPLVARLMGSLAHAGGGPRIGAREAEWIVSELPEVRAAERSGRPAAKQNGSSFWVGTEDEVAPDAKPGTRAARYEVSVAYLHPQEGASDRREPVYRFLVDAYTGEIFGEPLACEQLAIPLDRWRRLDGEERWDCDGLQELAR